MLHVIIALMPAFVAAAIIFGPRAAVVTVVCVASCVFFEYFFRAAVKKEQTVSDLSAVVTGMLLAFNLPVTMPLYMVVIGAFIAIVVVKQMFGGIGQNFANPAIVARIALMMSFSPQMSSWVKPFYYRLGGADAVTVASPLAADAPPDLKDLFFGINAGSLGETCAFALLLGFVYLLAARVIRPATPAAFVGVFAAATFFAGGDVLAGVLSGGLLLGAIFMATDYATTPLTPLGKIIFGTGCGLITFIIRQFGTMPEGVSFSILIMNILTPYIDKLTRPKPFGAV
jgi:electron transport complex protein RnfD